MEGQVFWKERDDDMEVRSGSVREMFTDAFVRSVGNSEYRGPFVWGVHCHAAQISNSSEDLSGNTYPSLQLYK